MTALALKRNYGRPRLRLTLRDAARAVAAGAAWGVMLTTALTAMSAWQYGIVCLPDVAVTAGLSITAGIITIGPLAAYGRR